MPLRFADAVVPRRVRWLWPGYIPFGAVTVLDGDPGVGKSTVLLDVSARLSTGTALPGGKQHAPMGTVLLMGEDADDITIVPRLMNAGACLSRIGIRNNYDNAGEQPIPPSFPSDLGRLTEDIIEAHAGLVIIDPVLAYLDPEINSNNDQQVRRALMPLAGMAEETGAAIVLLRHLNKSQGGNALYRGGGSIGFVGVARSALLIGRDPDDPTRLVLVSSKSNLGPQPPALTYALVGCENGAARIEWTGRSDHTAETLLQLDTVAERGAHAGACDFLRDLLGDHLPMLAKEVWRHVNEAGHSRQSTLKAAKTLGVVITKARTQSGPYSWQLPADVSGAGGTLDTSDTLNRSDRSDISKRNAMYPMYPMYPLQKGMDTSADTSKNGHFVSPAVQFPDIRISGQYSCSNCDTVQYMVEGTPQLCRACRLAAGHFGHSLDAD